MRNFTFIFSFILVLCCAVQQNAQAQDLEADSLALVDLYNDCGGANWDGYESWLNGPLSTWRDVTVTDGRVTHVLFKAMNLTGALPASLGNMTAMSGKIEIHNSPGLTGTFPSFIWNWTGVERLQIKNCGFTAIDVTGIEGMVNLYEFNTEGTPFAGVIPVEILKLPAMRDLYLHNCEWTGLPADMPIPTTTPIRRFYLSGNDFTDLPVLTGMVWASGAKIKLQDNMLTFEDIVPNMPIKGDANVSAFEYSPQGTIGEDMYVYAAAGSAVTLESNIGGVASTVYTWIKDGEDVVGETKDLAIASFDPATQSGTYFCLAQDANAPGLDIMTGMKMLYESPMVQDSLALVDLYNDCGGANWDGYESWLNGPLSTWRDVTVTDGRVTHVLFKAMNLTGTLPASLGNMTAMSGKIEIHNSPGLTGTFPSFIWNWTGVERLQIKNCGFTAIDVTGIEGMVNLYEFNTEGTPFAGVIPVEILKLPAMRDLYLHNCEWTGLPADIPIPTTTPIRRFYLSGNDFTDLPVLTGMVWASGAKIKLQDNMLTFEDIVPNMPIKGDANVSAFEYSPQGTIGEDMYVYAAAGSAVTLESNIGGVASTVYTWIKDGEDVVGETKDLAIASFDPATQSGTYFCLAQDANAPGLDIMTGMKMLYESPMVQDSLALVDLYNDCGGANWDGYESWLNGPLSTWRDVTVTDGRVTHVLFKAMNLTGTLPASLGNMTAMSGKIEIHNSPGLTGTFPSFIWNWTGVERLQIKNCGFTAIDVTGIEGMVNLYEFNTEGTPFAGVIPVEILKLPAMRDLYLHNCEWTGLPADMPIPTTTPIRRFYLSGNDFTDLPVLTGMVWASGAKIKLQDNMLTFEDIVPNMPIKGDANVSAFEYSPQGTIGEDMYVYAAAGSAVTLESNIGGVASTVYTWIKDGEDVVGETKDLAIASFDPATQSGTYFCLAQDANAPGLDIMTGMKMLYESPMVQDSLALVDLYNDCGGANWDGYESWLNGPLSTWRDVTVTDGRVTHVLFKAMNLTGTLPASLGNMTAMSGKIEIHNSPGLTGTFPSFIWNWTGVERLQIKNCGFTAIDVTGIEGMVNLYELNTEGTPFAGVIPVEILKLPAMRDLYLHNCEWTGLPADMPIPTTTPIRRFYLSGNDFTDLPDLTGMVWAEGTKIKIKDNMLTFEDLEPNMGIASDANVSAFEISPQAMLTAKDSIDLIQGDELVLGFNCGGSQNVYTWIKDGEVIEGANSDTLRISSAQKEDSGEYQCIVQNTLVAGLDLSTDTFFVEVNYPVSADIINKESFIRINGNPVRNMLSIDTEDRVDEVVIFDIAGRKLRHENVGTTRIRMNVSDLQNSIYVVVLKGKNINSTLKIIKK